MRQEVERKIATEVIDQLLKAGFAISIDNGAVDEDENGGYEIRNSTDKAAILKAMFLTDEEHLYAERGGKTLGWVFFVYGNDGWDVINDYTVNLEGYIGENTPVDTLIKQYE